MKIKYLRNYEINTIKWDRCINRSYNGIIYAYSWYLNIVSEEWEALVLGDYASVMPLTWNRKYGIRYLYQPFFTQQLGVFSTKKLDAATVQLFLKKIPAKYKFIDINLNVFNKLPDKIHGAATPKVNFQLDLIKNYQHLFSNYSENTRRNVRKAEKNKVQVISSLTTNQLIDFARKNLSEKVKEFQSRHYDMLRILVSFALRHKIGEILAAYDEHNTLCAAAFFLTSHNKSIFLISVSNPVGKKNRAMFGIVDFFIRKNAEKNLTLDFEGSNIEGVARFYRGFGAQACNYTHYKQNRLPWVLKMLKK